MRGTAAVTLTNVTCGISRTVTLKPALLLFDRVIWTCSRNEALAAYDEFRRFETYRDSLLAVTNSSPDDAKLLDVLKGLHGAQRVVPVLDSQEAFAREFDSGERLVYQAAVNNIATVSTDVSWEQIAEFRMDNEATQRYRALRPWLYDFVSSRSIQEATDRIHQAIESYEWALKKHAISTVTGTLSQIVDSKTVLALAAAGGIIGFAASPTIGALSAAALAVSKAALTFAEHRLRREDLRHGDSAGVAFIHA